MTTATTYQRKTTKNYGQEWVTTLKNGHHVRTVALQVQPEVSREVAEAEAAKVLASVAGA